MAKSVAIRGCIIVGQDDNTTKYQKKCDKCGTVISGTCYTPSPGTGNTVGGGDFHCTKCNNAQSVVIKGV